MVDIATAMDRMDRQSLAEKMITVARTVIDERLTNMEQRQGKLAQLTTKLLDTLDVADRAAAIVVAKLDERMPMQNQPQGWVSIETAMPKPDQWYTGLVIQRENDFNTGETATRYRLVRGYPNKITPANLFPEMHFWFPLPSPIGLPFDTVNNVEVTKIENEDEKEKSE